MKLYRAVNGMFVIVLLVLVVGLAGCRLFDGRTPRSKDLLVVGVNPFMPYVILDDQGDLQGFDIDLMKKVALQMGKKIEFKDIPFDSMTIELMQGKVDLIIGGLSITRDRLKKIAMVHYVGAGKKSLPLVFWKKIPDGVATIEDVRRLPNRTICVQPGSLQEDLFARFDFLELKLIDGIGDMMLEIGYGKSLACALEHHVVHAMIRQYPELKLLDVPLPDNLQDEGIGIGINRDRSDLVAEIKKIIDQYKSDGTLHQLQKTWFEGAV